MTWNIRLDHSGDGPDRWEFRREAMATEILNRKPAVIGFQEVLLNQLTFLEEKLPNYRRVGVARDDGKEKGEFSPVFYDTTEFRLISGRTLWLSPTPETPSKGWDAALPRVATLAILKEKRGKDTLWVVNTHFDHIGKEARLHSAELIVKTLEPALKMGKKVIFMGDLNAEPTEPPILFLQQQLSESCPVIQSDKGTFNGFDIKRTTFPRIDYVWLSKGNWTVENYEVPMPKVKDRQVSDHFPVLVRLR